MVLYPLNPMSVIVGVLLVGVADTHWKVLRSCCIGYMRVRALLELGGIGGSSGLDGQEIGHVVGMTVLKPECYIHVRLHALEMLRV